jgi:hypothetical protein
VSPGNGTSTPRTNPTDLIKFSKMGKSYPRISNVPIGTGTSKKLGVPIYDGESPQRFRNCELFFLQKSQTVYLGLARKWAAESLPMGARKV